MLGVVGGKRNVAVVTGAAKGIGRAVSRRVLQQGWDVVMVDWDASVTDVAAALTVEAAAHGASAEGLRMDVRSEADVAEAVARAAARGTLALAMANAGIGAPYAALPDLAVDEYRRVVDVNLMGTFLTCKYAARVMREAQRGAIVVTSSVMWQDPVPGEAVYNATKAAVVALTQTLALDLAPFGVRANVIAPGAVLTEMHIADMERRAAAQGKSVAEVRLEDDAAIPLGHVADPAEIADVVAFLASDESRYITGQVISVNGGAALHF